MSYRQLDAKGKPIPRKGRNKREPATRGEGDAKRYHYAIAVAIKQPGKRYKHILRHMWLSNDQEAADAERKLRRKPSGRGLTWEEAFAAWVEDNRENKSPRHMANVQATRDRWVEAFGADKAVEKTELGEFTTWIRERARSGKGRGAQLDQAHLLAVARWCRENGLVEEIPFDHAPKPKDRTEKVLPAGIEEFHAVDGILPAHIGLVWRLLGFTGMRLGAACGLLEEDIADSEFTVTTKGDKRVTYPITAPVREIFLAAREWKAERGFERPHLFCNSRGERWTSKSLGKRISRIIEQWNDPEQLKKHPDREAVPEITAHQLRHLAGTILGEQNFEVPTIMAALGHVNPASSQVYVDKTQKMRNTAMEALIKNLSKSAPKTDITTVFLDEATGGKITADLEIACPCCHHKLLITKKKEAQP